MDDMINVIEIKSNMLLGIRLSPRINMRHVVNRMEINKPAKDQTESIEILQEALDKWFGQYPSYIQYNATIGEEAKKFDHEWIRIWDNSFKCFKASVHRRMMEQEHNNVKQMIVDAMNEDIVLEFKRHEIARLCQIIHSHLNCSDKYEYDRALWEKLVTDSAVIK